MIKKLLFFFSFLFIQSYNGQDYSCDIRFSEKSIHYSFIQSYYKKDIEIEQIINNITSTVGLQPNFISLSYPNYNNCAAINMNGFRYIIYDKDFLNELSKNGNKKAIVTSVISHEIAHHLQGHTTNNTNLKDRKYNELEADKFAGYISAKIGYNLNDAVAFIAYLNIIDNSSTHPNKSERLSAVKLGYELGKSEISNTIARAKLSIESEILAKSDEYFLKGEEFRQDKKYDEAINSFFKSLALKDDYLPLILISQCYLEQKDYINAVKILKNLEISSTIKKQFLKDLLYYNLGYSYFKLNDYENSIKYYSKVVNADNNDIIAKAKLASAYYYNNELDNAYSIFNNSSFDDKLQSSGLQDFSIADIFLEKGLVYNEKKQDKLAITYFEKAEKLFWQGHPSKLLAKFYVAKSYKSLNNEKESIYYDTFIEEYNQTLEVNKDILKSQYIESNFGMAKILRDKFAKTYNNNQTPDWITLKKSTEYLLNILKVDEKNGQALVEIGVNWMAHPDFVKNACTVFKQACELGEFKGCEYYRNSTACK